MPGELLNNTLARRTRLKRKCSPHRVAEDNQKCCNKRLAISSQQVAEENQNCRNKRLAMTPEHVTQQKDKRRKVYLDQKTKKWKRAAANCDVLMQFLVIPKQPQA